MTINGSQLTFADDIRAVAQALYAAGWTTRGIFYALL
jgi:hypothetical protein